MVQRREVVSYWEAIADSGLGKDADLAWGWQCADVPNDTGITFFGQTILGNAIDMLDSAEALGFPVWRMPTEENPKAGMMFVSKVAGHDFGHTGLVRKDSDGYTMETIEQNIEGYSDLNSNGINDQLEWGGPARYNTRDFSDVIGWFDFPYDDTLSGFQLPEPSEPVTIESSESFNLETGTFTVEVPALNVRAEAGLSADIVAVYTNGMQINYDGWVDRDGYIWVTYIGGSGLRRYVAVGKSENGKRVTNFGSFS